MKYLDTEDLKSLIKENTLDDLSEEDYGLFDKIEEFSISQINAYIGNKFDVTLALESNNGYLKMLLLDLFIYHLSTRMTHINPTDVRQDRYEDSLNNLKDMSIGKLNANLPLLEKEVGDKSINSFYYSKKKYSEIY